jgi:carbamoyl-phosphate synthase large subunit
VAAASPTTARSSRQIVARGIDASPTSEVLLEESVIGWKEFEMEVVRDRADNCIIVCAIENLDPMGVHTGDSITVAPAQTLTDKRVPADARCVDRGAAQDRRRHRRLERAVRDQPDDGRMLVIEMNPRVSRSSALASKATGFPIAKVAAKLAVGYTLDELKNDITGGATPASFEPSIDYVVTKIPRFTFEKFPGANDRLTTQMKSVGRSHGHGPDVPGIAAEGAARPRDGIDGLTSAWRCRSERGRSQRVRYELRMPGPERLLYVADAFRAGWSLERVQEARRTSIRGSSRRSKT